MSKLSTNFAMDFLFKSGLPPLVSSFQLNKILKSPAKVKPVFSCFILTGFEALPNFSLAQFQY